ncbi:MAG TPA: group II intron reverse transcriptase/maturase [Kiritimatiellia bacterium]|nr:group II intron reverse transcriptase/maturase [Kiritimatiellia bacterium]
MEASTTGYVDDWVPVRTEPGMPPKLVAWRQKLSEKAKHEKKFRFYTLYGLVGHPDTLRWAWVLVRRNNGAPGVDGTTFEQIEQREGGVDRFLNEVEQALKEKTYKAQPVRRVYIEKENGKLRPLGIPVIKDRVVQMAVKLIIEPIFEADFNDCSYGYRPGRSAKDAIQAIQAHLKDGKGEVYDADLSGYFDSIPHDKLMACLRERIVDGGVLRLIRQWLKAPVVEPADKGKGPKVTRQDKGTPQGGVISPLLANLYLHWFEVVLLRELKRGRVVAGLVRYADDFVILSSHLTDQLTLFVEEKLEGWMGLRINREKTRCINLRQDGQRLDFLGYSLRYDRDLRGGPWKYLNVFPSPKALKRERAKVQAMTDKRQCFTPVPELIDRMNRHLKGWANYYAHGYPRKAYRDMNHYVRQRLAIHLQRRSQRGYKLPEGQTYYQHLDELGLITL